MLMHCITFAFSQCFMHYRCVLSMLKLCVLVGLDWAMPMRFLLLNVICSFIFHAYVPLFSILLIFILFGTFSLLSLSLSFFRLVCAWHPSTSLLHPGTFFVLGHYFLLILLLMSSFVMIKPVRTFRRTFLHATFIWNAKSSFRTFPILTYLLSFTVGVGSPFVTSRSVVPL